VKDLTDFSALVEEFATLDDQGQRADLLIELSEDYSEVPSGIVSRPYPESLKVPGCESEVYFFAVSDDEGGSFKFYFAVDNPQGISAMAMAAFIDQTLSGVQSELVASIEEDFVHTLFGKQLSMGKGQGLTNMVMMVKRLASGAVKMPILPKS